MMSARLRIGVIFGGTSSEHNISLLTARGVLGAIDRTRYEVVPIGISRAGAWAAGTEVLERLTLEAKARRREDRSPSSGTGVDAGIDAISRAMAVLSQEGIDAVFPLLHGPMGEDGTLQGLLELCGVPYVGCGVAASAVAMDKGLAKDVFRSHGIPTLPWIMIRRGAWRSQPESTLSGIESKFPYPLFVKPANLGSSVGISRVDGRNELIAGLDLAAHHDERLLVEPGIDAREIEVGILGNSDPQASVAGEIRPRRKFYDYKAKYFDDATELIVPAALEGALSRKLQAWAVQSFEALTCSGIARVDFLLERNTDQVYVSEVNTMPGFTESSMYPRLWEASGIGYGELIDRLLDFALERRKADVV